MESEDRNAGWGCCRAYLTWLWVLLVTTWNVAALIVKAKIYVVVLLYGCSRDEFWFVREYFRGVVVALLVDDWLRYACFCCLITVTTNVSRIKPCVAQSLTLSGVALVLEAIWSKFPMPCCLLCGFSRFSVCKGIFELVWIFIPGREMLPFSCVRRKLNDKLKTRND